VKSLRRELGLVGAVGLGLGSMVGTGVGVALGLAAERVGSVLGVALAVLLAALLASANAMSSARLAAAFPVSGGTYEYGHRVLVPAAGFAAGWLFLVAKSASAATAALALAGYLVEMLPDDAAGELPLLRRLLAGALVGAVGGLAWSGLRPARTWLLGFVAITLGTLLVYVMALAPAAVADPVGSPGIRRLDGPWLVDLLGATGLVFVAFTGYGRIATLGEEVRDPGRTIPRAVVVTMLVTTAIYLGIAATTTAMLGPEAYGAAAAADRAPLVQAAEAAGRGGILGPLLVIAAASALLAVLLNLILGLSRVVLAMGRRGDLPAVAAGIHEASSSPRSAVLVVVVVLLGLVAWGEIAAAWSLSAVTVLVYYGLTNLAALRLDPARRRLPLVVPLAGLVGCLGLAITIDVASAALGAALLAVGFVLRTAVRSMRR